MAIIVGSGEYRYRIVEDWARLPEGWSFKEVGAVPANGSPIRDNSLPWLSTMLTRGPKLALRRLTESSPI